MVSERKQERKQTRKKAFLTRHQNNTTEKEKKMTTVTTNAWTKEELAAKSDEELSEIATEYFLTRMDRANEAYKQARELGISNKPANKGSRWGSVNSKNSSGAGIVDVSCQGHGGYLISPARVCGIPTSLLGTCADRLSGVFEEDCDAPIVIVSYPRETRRTWIRISVKAFRDTLQEMDDKAWIARHIESLLYNHRNALISAIVNEE